MRAPGRSSLASCTARCCGSCSPRRRCRASLAKASTRSIIGVIVAASVGLGFVNEYRAERAAEAMHSEIRHVVAVDTRRPAGERRGHPPRAGRRRAPRRRLDRARRPAAPRAEQPRVRRVDPDRRVRPGREVRRRRSRPTPRSADLSSCLFMGTVVHEGAADAVVVATGAADPVRADRRRARRTAPPDRVPARPHPLLGAAGQGRRRAQRHDLRRSTSLLGRPVIEPCCSRSPSRSASPPSCCPPSSRPAWPPARGGSPRRRCSSSGWCASRTSATSTCCSPTRPAPSPTAASASNEPSTPTGDDSPDVLTLGLVCNEATADRRHRRRRQPARRRPVGGTRRG